MLFTIIGENGATVLNLPGALCFQLVAVCLVLGAIWKSKHRLAESIRAVLLAVAVGQSAVLLLTVAFQVSENAVLIRLDNWLNLFYARHYRWFEFPFLTFTGIVILLITLDFFFRRARLVTRFLKLERYLHIVSVALAAFTSFTFAAPYPYSLGVDRDAKVMPRAKSPKEEVETKQLNRVSAEILKRAFGALPPIRLRGYAGLVEHVDKNVRWTHREEELRSSLGSLFSDDIPPPDPSESKPDASRNPEEALAGTTAGEAWVGLFKVLNKALSELIAVPEGTLGELAKTMVELFSEKLWERGYRFPPGQRFQAVVEKISAWITPRIEALGRKLDVDREDRGGEMRGKSESPVIDLDLRRERRESPLTTILQERNREATEPKGAEEK